MSDFSRLVCILKTDGTYPTGSRNEWSIFILASFPKILERLRMGPRGNIPVKKVLYDRLVRSDGNFAIHF